jgi:hypothetical protein
MTPFIAHLLPAVALACASLSRSARLVRVCVERTLAFSIWFCPGKRRGRVAMTAGKRLRSVHWRTWCSQVRRTRPLWASIRATLAAAWRQRREAARIYAELSQLSDDDLRRCGLERRDLYWRALDMARS